MTFETFRGPGGSDLVFQRDDATAPWKDTPTAILAHGFPRNSNLWYSWVPLLAADVRVIRPDLRGLGRSTVPVETFRNSVDSLVLDALALLDFLRVEKAIWIGEATGAVVGAELAARVPQRLHCLVVMTLPLEVRAQRLVEHTTDMRPGEALFGSAGIDFMLRYGMREWGRVSARNRPWLREAPEGYVEWYVNQIALNDPLLCAEFYRPMPDVDLRATVSRIQVPTLYLEGSRDQMLLEEHRALLASLPHVRFATIDGPGIDIGYSRPGQCVEEVRRFLRGLGVLA